MLVDGYNVIHASRVLSGIPELDYARAALCDMLADYAGYRDLELIIVFDAHLQPDAEHMERGAATVVYTGAGETADMFIERAVRSYFSGGRSVCVVTSDALEQMMVLGYASRMSSRELLIDVERAKAEYTRHYINAIRPKEGTLESRLNDEHRNVFERLRRGKSGGGA